VLVAGGFGCAAGKPVPRGARKRGHIRIRPNRLCKNSPSRIFQRYAFSPRCTNELSRARFHALSGFSVTGQTSIHSLDCRRIE
jgi:hypothetical protein